MQYLQLIISSALSTLVAMLLVLKLFPKWKLMDRPKDYGLTRDPIPYSAGIVIFIVFALHVLFFFEMSKEFIGLLLAGGIIVATSFIDDFRRIAAWKRLLIQILCGVIIVLTGTGIEVITNPFGGYFDLTAWQVPYVINGVTYHLMPIADIFTIAWFIFVMNAINFLDGIPGLVTGIGTIAALTLFTLSLLLIASPLTTPFEKLEAETIANMALLIGTILFVFNRFDFFPPKVVIGDSGAMFIGYILAILSIFAGGKVATTLIVLGLPLIDSVWVIIRRLSKKQSPMQGDFNHYHFKLLRLGFSERTSLLILYGMSAILGVVAILFLFYLQTFGKFIMIAVITILIFLTSYLLIKKETNNLKKT